MPLFVFLNHGLNAQDFRLDSTLTDYEKKVLDSLDKDLDEFLQPVTMYKSFVDISVTGANSYYDFKTNNSNYLKSGNNFTLLPAIAYYHKSGFAINATGCAMYDNQSMNLYQFVLSPSYDYSNNKTFSFGIVYSHFFTRDSLSFYTTPLNNEIFLNFVLKKPWLQPSVSMGFGWGSRNEYKKESVFIHALLASAKPRTGIITANQEAIRDFVLSFSLRHSFSWHHLFLRKDVLLFTPQAMFTSGTQHYGFNTTYSFDSQITASIPLPVNSSISDDTGWMLQSVSLIMRTDYIIGSFYIEPQFIADYYIPNSVENNLHCIMGIGIGLNF